MSTHTTLILGAGASKTYGYPTGIELRKEILKLEEHLEDIINYSSGNSLQVKNFFKSFKYSSLYSIDSFVEKNPAYEEIAKIAISIVLLNCENISQLFDESLEDNWYQYFFNEICTKTLEDINFSKIRIVTFNYDQSFEHFLLVALSNTYKKSEEEILRKFDQLDIHHVYGRISKPFENYGDIKIQLSSGDDDQMRKNKQILQTISAGIDLIPSSRSGKSVFGEIQSIVSQSQNIGFLGFGFLRENIPILTGGNHISTLENNKFMAATCKGMTKAEIDGAMKLINGRDPSYFGENIKLINGNCTNMLRETLILNI